MAIYQCGIREQGNSNWIPTQVFIAHDEASGRVVVNDPIINYANDQQPLEGKVAVQNNKRTTFAWTIKDFTSSSGQFVPGFEYRATFYKADSSMVVTATPLGYANDFRGKGRCQVGQQ